MRTDIRRIAFAYLRLSNEEAAEGESSSIKNQRMIIQDYCERNEILLVRVFVDDGWSGGNFDRPAFQEMIALLEQGKANIVITKDLSRLGRDMREASYYAEQYFPEHGIRYLTVADNFDTEQENVMAPFQFAMNEVYLRDSLASHLCELLLGVGIGEPRPEPVVPFGLRPYLSSAYAVVVEVGVGQIGQLVVGVFEVGR